MNENIMREMGFGKEMDAVKAGKCPSCEQPVDPNSFRDELSRKEYGISGLCQPCQDKTFGPGDADSRPEESEEEARLAYEADQDYQRRKDQAAEDRVDRLRDDRLED